MQCVARRIVDRTILSLIKMWLKAPVEERDRQGTRRMSGGKGSKHGTPQGGVISPLLANIYINRFLKFWRIEEKTQAFRAHIVSYADDFVILSRGRAVEALAWTRGVMTRLGLSINETKTSLKNARQERFDFLGYSFGPHIFRKNGRRYLSASPSRKSVQRLKDGVAEILVPGNLGAWPDVRDRLNRKLRGWSAYFNYGTRMPAYRAIDNHVYDHVRHFLKRRHKTPGRGTTAFSAGRVFGDLGVLRLRNVHLGPKPKAAT